MRWIGQGLLLAVVVTVVGLSVPTPASASCVSTPVASPHRFIGTVTQVDNRGRTAVVRTADGRTVTVRGSDAEGAAATTVDRVYAVGTRYEFHPINDSSPYQDNACTATHPIGRARTDASAVGGRADGDRATQPARDRVDWPWWAGGAAVLAAAATGSVIVFRRRGNRFGFGTRPGA